MNQVEKKKEKMKGWTDEIEDEIDFLIIQKQ
jgi:hypothetical protein